MRIRNLGRRRDDVTLMMTPMIDIVFLLLVFFIMTFKIASPEGDFNIKMPLAAPSEGKPDDLQLPPLKVRLTADADGRLAGILLNQAKMKDFRQLHDEIVAIVGGDTGPDSIVANQEIELDCDYRLDFKYVIDAITAVSGEVTPDGEIVKLFDKIKFAPPREG